MRNRWENLSLYRLEGEMKKCGVEYLEIHHLA
jgi:hypothetical protein